MLTFCNNIASIVFTRFNKGFATLYYNFYSLSILCKAICYKHIIDTTLFAENYINIFCTPKESRRRLYTVRGVFCFSKLIELGFIKFTEPF